MVEDAERRHIIGPNLSDMTFGEVVGILRRRAKITQKEIGTGLGLSESTFSRIESGEREFPQDKYEAILGLLMPRFEDPEEIKSVLDESFKRDELITQLGQRFSSMLRGTQSTQRLSNLNSVLKQPAARESFNAFVGQLADANEHVKNQ